jgi:8-oxo-dGTP pyrophosphatase MutT (NUDIX family)
MSDRRRRFVSAVHLFLFRDDRVLLLRRQNTGFADGWYSVPAGHLDGDERVVEAMVREASEEVGIAIDPDRLRVVGVMHRRAPDERIDFFLSADAWAGEIVNAEPEKCDDLAWFRRDRLPANVVPYVAQALENVARGRWFDEFGWDDRRYAPDDERSDR